LNTVDRALLDARLDYQERRYLDMALLVGPDFAQGMKQGMDLIREVYDEALCDMEASGEVVRVNAWNKFTGR
jgi:hypothetical protein